MKTLTKTAESVFRAAMARALETGQAKIHDNTISMALCVVMFGHIPTAQSRKGDALPFPLWSFAHYYEQEGDLMRDPDITMVDTPAGLMPISYRNDGLGIDNTYVEYADDGTIRGFYPAKQADLTAFCNTWARNLKDQQGL